MITAWHLLCIPSVLGTMYKKYQSLPTFLLRPKTDCPIRTTCRDGRSVSRAASRSGEKQDTHTSLICDHL
jgi:hypothetical protein